MHMAASVRETRAVPCTNHSTVKLATAIRYQIYKHSRFLYHKVVRALPNATVTVIITLKTILNEKVRYHFCQVILLF